LKLKVGQGVAEARAIHPAIEVVEQDPDADKRLLESLADWCDRYTPLVALDGTDGLFLDITGCAHLFGGERGLLHDLNVRFFHQGFDVRIGLASTPGAAWASARYAGSTVVAPGAEAALLAPLPVAALRLAMDTCAGLESVGLRTTRHLLATPRGPLVRRFGRHVALRLDQALGHVEEAISPRLAVPPLSVERHLAEPIGLMEEIESLILLLSTQLKKDLERRGEGIERIELLLFRVDGMVSRIAVGASHPLREPKLIRKLFHERLTALGSALDAGYGFDLVRLSVLVATQWDEAQADLGDRTGNAEEGISLFVDRVRARLGTQAILQHECVESHLPERAVRAIPYAQAPSVRKHITAVTEPTTAAPATAVKERPIRLFDLPECIEVTAAEVPEGPPLLFRWRRASYRVARSEGPERIAPEWWRQADGETRDYFRVEDETGRRYWLYRQGQYGVPGTTPRWFLQGMFA